ncbi:MAG: hypothetical protein O9346_06500 [Leptospiraceae bacterium]|nr:hypothetical protein [Leptospiraceae bacterium]MCZ8346047.1 hypothetical protein [Leptospiraceae bacterium]
MNSKFLQILALGFFLSINCGKSQTLVIVPEPLVDQVSAISPEICLDSFLWIFPSNPCFWLKAEKDNTNAKTRTSLVYNLSSFDVEFPLGLSLEIDGTYFNLLKLGTEYGSQLQLVSDLPEPVALAISKANKVSLSYTNRKETRNYNLSSGEVSDLKNYLAKLSSLIKAEPKLKIQK